MNEYRAAEINMLREVAGEGEEVAAALSAELAEARATLARVTALADSTLTHGAIVQLSGIPATLHLMRFRVQVHLDHLVRSAEERLGLPITDRGSFVA